jgi:cold shock protein
VRRVTFYPLISKLHSYWEKPTWRWGRSRFNVTKGYGFIKPAESGPDVFVHISVVQKAGYSDLVEGARISYELVANRSGKMSAENLRLG